MGDHKSICLLSFFRSFSIKLHVHIFKDKKCQTCWRTPSSCAVVYQFLTHLSPTSHKRDISKQCGLRSDAAERGFWSGSALFALNSGISMKHGNNKNKPDTPSTGNGPIRKVKVEESIRRKWVNLRPNLEVKEYYAVQAWLIRLLVPAAQNDVLLSVSIYLNPFMPEYF